MVFTAMVTATALFFGCTPARDWEDPEYIQYQLEEGNSDAFKYLGRLSKEQQREFIPTLVEIYNSNTMQKESLRALLNVPDEQAEAVFRNALDRTDDSLAVFGARGLAAIEANNSSLAIAQRIQRITDKAQYVGFFEALEKVPSSEAIDTVASVLMRPADQIGGVGTVRKGCRIIGQIEDPSDAGIDALIFSLVNFNPMPYDDAVKTCEFALIKHLDQAWSEVITLYKAENSRVNSHLESLDYNKATGQLRAAMIFWHTRDPRAAEPIRQWLQSDHPVPEDEISEMTLEEQQNWYSNHGQLFEISTKALGNLRRDQDRELLRGLTSPEEGSPLFNFKRWFGLSSMAEMGLRQAAADALVTLGNAQDREKLWEYAKSGDIGRGSERIDTLFHLNMLHVLGRTPKSGELAKFQDAAEAQPERFMREILPLSGYYIAGEQCDSLECWSGILDNADEVVAHEAAQAAINFEPESDGEEQEAAEGADAAEEQGLSDEMKAAREESVRSAAQTAAVWTLILEYGDQPAAQEALAGALTHDREVIKNLIPTAMLVLPSVTDSAKETIESKLEELGIGAQAIGTSDYAQMLHVIVLTR
jgi:hypothetical protein